MHLVGADKRAGAALPAQALERLGGLLESQGGSVTLQERGDVQSVPRAPGFRLFAAMNPATDAGAALKGLLGYR